MFHESCAPQLRYASPMKWVVILAALLFATSEGADEAFEANADPSDVEPLIDLVVNVGLPVHR